MVMVIDDNGREGSRGQERFQSLTESRRRPSRHHVVLQTVPSGGSSNSEGQAADARPLDIRHQQAIMERPY